MSCPQCVGIERMFDEKEAQRELKFYREKGPYKTATKLLDALREAGVDGASHLDVGGGVGALQHELFKAGVSTVVNVDGSSAYIAAATEEAERQGTRDKVTYHQGNFIDIAPTLEQADIVTLDRVLCCFPDVDDMVVASTAKARKYYGVVYPRNWLLSRVVVKVGNLALKVRGNPFRIFVHKPRHIDDLIRNAGFQPRYEGKTLVWHVALYERAAG